jgi:hypothetical protein
MISACSNDETDDIGCWEFHHSRKYRSPDYEWESYKDTICNISEIEAEKYRTQHEISDNNWIRRCSKQRITSPHTHTKSIIYNSK